MRSIPLLSLWLLSCVLTLPVTAQATSCGEPDWRYGMYDQAHANCSLVQVITIDLSYPAWIREHTFAFAIVEHSLLDNRYNFLSYMADTPDFQHRAEFSIRNSHSTTWYSDTLVSLVLHFDEDSGGAHPHDWIETFTFDLASEQVIMLEDLFVDVDLALPILADAVKAQEGADIFSLFAYPADGAEADIENYRTFILREGALVLMLPPHRVGPIHAGMIEVAVPLAEVEALLASDGLALERNE